MAWAFTHIQGEIAPTDQLDEDYAVLVMNENERFGDQFGWLGIKEYDSDWDGETHWSWMGYTADGTFPMFQTDQWLDEDALDFGSGRAMTTSANLVGGQSGSPMFGNWVGDDVSYVVAVMTSGPDEEGKNWCAGGSELNDLVAQAREGDP